ncbi:hypothetical protein D9C73_022480 [Collichthys lucidus]|uniref:Uncharacterized protein n=1 Tax=Collichthys lucidus TaxID=240159 RepID=A0A4U5VLH3_COLLU|nr:hypothetical protein D9C73_022480 [Collichthys lucidus]
MSVEEDGAVKVAQQRCNMSAPQCLQRPVVIKCLYCSACPDIQESRFNRVLLCCFLVGLAFRCVQVRAPYYGSGYRHHETLEFGYFEIGQTEKALVAMFVVTQDIGGEEGWGSAALAEIGFARTPCDFEILFGPLA